MAGVAIIKKSRLPTKTCTAKPHNGFKDVSKGRVVVWVELAIYIGLGLGLVQDTPSIFKMGSFARYHPAAFLDSLFILEWISISYEQDFSAGRLLGYRKAS